jgi:hypothetical protein
MSTVLGNGMGQLAMSYTLYTLAFKEM